MGLCCRVFTCLVESWPGHVSEEEEKRELPTECEYDKYLAKLSPHKTCDWNFADIGLASGSVTFKLTWWFITNQSLIGPQRTLGVEGGWQEAENIGSRPKIAGTQHGEQYPVWLHLFHGTRWMMTNFGFRCVSTYIYPFRDSYDWSHCCTVCVLRCHRPFKQLRTLSILNWFSREKKIHCQGQRWVTNCKLNEAENDIPSTKCGKQSFWVIPLGSRSNIRTKSIPREVMWIIKSYVK